MHPLRRLQQKGLTGHLPQSSTRYTQFPTLSWKGYYCTHKSTNTQALAGIESDAEAAAVASQKANLKATPWHTACPDSCWLVNELLA